MGDFNELQPEEKAYPVIVQGLQTAYRLTPQERQVLERVQERLTQHATRTLLSCQQIRQKVTLQTKTASRSALEAVLRGGDGES
ncbi:MAG TPA: hypothetical protein VFN35_21750 [Ktedonobacteraceae bacterium]|nr:hypothetical protein [Ktedonobacteraceae bacterium]